MTGVLLRMCGMLTLLPLGGFASVVNLGVISFDVLIPGSTGTSGVNVFEISNLTGAPTSGGYALPPDFPDLTAETFLDATLTLNGDGSTQTIGLGDVGPGVYPSGAALQFASTMSFASATFSAMLSDSQMTLSDGGLFAAGSPVISAVLLPSSESSLTPGTDLAVLAATSVPEPKAAELVFCGLVALLSPLVFRSRRRVSRPARSRY